MLCGGPRSVWPGPFRVTILFCCKVFAYRWAMWVRVVLVVTVLLVGGCTRSLPPSSSPAVPVISSAPRNAGAERTVPDDCDAIATLDDLSRILNTLVAGPVQRVVGVPQDDIGRVARLDCYYGVPVGQPVSVAKIWIGLTGYVNAESARKRLTATVAAESAASLSDVAVGSDRGVLVRNADWMLVAVRGRTTVVVKVVSGVVGDEHAGLLLGQVADFALTRR